MCFCLFAIIVLIINKESKIVYNGKTVKLSEAQAGLDDEISILKNKLLKIQ